jgi:hypothetical protein
MIAALETTGRARALPAVRPVLLRRDNWRAWPQTTIESPPWAGHTCRRKERERVMKGQFFLDIESHWREHRPKMIKSLEAQGLLEQAIEYAADRTAAVARAA